MSAAQNEIPSDLDNVLDKFNIFGRYHRLVMLLVILGFASHNISSTNFIFTVAEVKYRCASGDYVNMSGSSVGNASPHCTEWIYDNPNSFVAEFDLACQEWKRTLVGTAHSSGYMIGLLLLGPLSDRLGRKQTIVICGVLGGLIGVARSFSPWYWLYVSSEFLSGVIGDICSPVYIMMIELVSTKKRVTFTVICTLGYACGSLITSLIASQEYYWRNHLRVIYTPALFFFIYYFLLDESPRWLLSKGRKEDAIKILKNAAQKNGIKLDNNVLDDIHYENEKKANFGYLLKSTFTSNVLAIRLVVCITWWTVSLFIKYGLMINSVSLPGNKYVNYAILALLELPGHLVIMLLMLKFNRKYPLMATFAFGAIFCIAQSFVDRDIAWLATTLFMVGKLSLSLNIVIIYLFTSELFPTHSRNSMHALCSSVGRIGSIVATQTPLLMQYWPPLPVLLFGVASLVGLSATTLVPDTARDALPDTVRQAEDIGKNGIEHKLTNNVKDELRISRISSIDM